jgi:hypothetical protein
MKKILLTLVSVAVLFAFSGCNGGDKDSGNTYVNTTNPNSAPVNTPVNIGYNDFMVYNGPIKVANNVDSVYVVRTGGESFSYKGYHDDYCYVDMSLREKDEVIIYTSTFDGWNTTYINQYKIIITRQMLQERRIW